MKRRGMLGGLLAAGCILPRGVRADAEPVELQDYVRLDPPVAVALPRGARVEAIEFFWYECPHCDAFEPVLQEWRARQPDDVAFRYVPVGYTPRHVPAQRLHLALEAIGEAEPLHGRIYRELHETHRRIDARWQLIALARALGVDEGRFAAALDSPAVDDAVRAANRIVEAHRVDGVPTLSVQGRFVTSPEMAGGRRRALEVLDWLVARARRES